MMASKNAEPLSSFIKERLFPQSASAPASATRRSFSTVSPDTPIAPKILPRLSLSGNPPGKVISPPLECSIAYNAPPRLRQFS